MYKTGTFSSQLTSLIDEIDMKSELPLAVQMQVLQYLSDITERQKEAQWNRDDHRNHPLKTIN